MLFELIDKGRASKEKLNRARILHKADCGDRLVTVGYDEEKSVYQLEFSADDLNSNLVHRNNEIDM